jgi:hypothetical protein
MNWGMIRVMSAALSVGAEGAVFYVAPYIILSFFEMERLQVSPRKATKPPLFLLGKEGRYSYKTKLPFGGLDL